MQVVRPSDRGRGMTTHDNDGARPTAQGDVSPDLTGAGIESYEVAAATDGEAQKLASAEVPKADSAAGEKQ